MHFCFNDLDSSKRHISECIHLGLLPWMCTVCVCVHLNLCVCVLTVWMHQLVFVCLFHPKSLSCYVLTCPLPPPCVGAGQTCGQISSQAGVQGDIWVWCSACGNLSAGCWVFSSGHCLWANGRGVASLCVWTCSQSEVWWREVEDKIHAGVLCVSLYIEPTTNPSSIGTYTHIIRMVMVIGALLHEETSSKHRTGYLTIYIGAHFACSN